MNFLINLFTDNEGPATGKEAVRRKIVNVIFIIYWLLIFEGALRKWFFPSMHKVLFFIRDPFVLYTYYLCIRYGMWPRWRPIFVFGVGLGMFFLVLAMLQAVVYSMNPLISAIGWRGYFWYVPMVFIIGEHFRGRDLKRLLKQSLLITIPVAFIVYMQFKTGPGSFWNKSFDEDSMPLLVTKEIVRTSGTFTFSVGQVSFIATNVALLLTAWLLPVSDRPLRRQLLWLVTATVLVCIYTAGSRSAFFASAISLAAAMISGLVMTSREQQLRALMLPGIISVIGAIFYVTVFNTAYEAMVERQAIAAANEGNTLFRAAGILTALFENLPRSTFIGIGVGMGSNAGAVLATGARTFSLSEVELPRIVDESGLVPGLLYIGLRYWLILYLLVGAVKATRRSNNPLPLLLLSYDAVCLAVGQMTLQGTINGYGWLFAGFCLAANNLGTPSGRRLMTARRPSRITRRLTA